jgi:hypothetical protein
MGSVQSSAPVPAYERMERTGRNGMERARELICDLAHAHHFLPTRLTHTYTHTHLQTPIQVLDQLLRPGGRFLYAAPSTGRDGLPEFLAGLGERAGLKLVAEKAAPEALLGNPLASGSDDDFLLHFHELATGEHQYRLYEFVKE